ncbi:Hsp70 family protein [Haloplasma contractile]|uniref:Chaperone protein DnaK n=1 Tax=Haloplasma contractile SSD-17B TaxID=1033810 RepID=U2DRE5_9MOLU|nr:Hsp70 family protein [Haloplasma contractile]ERJ11147.1 Chaperone protein DnaK [Haloplasma contractile SSD-17B]
MKNNLFLGIDLGTTNSVISYLNIDPLFNRIEPKVFDVIRMDEYNTSRKKTLPSVVYYKRNTDHQYIPYVGDYAKLQLGKRYGHVVKSVKKYMGKDDVPELYDEVKNASNDHRPEDVSARIITHLISHVKDIMNLTEMPNDVVITIPASFDPDMCEATKKAAKKAGITSGRDDHGHELLLYEPRAVLYDFINLKLRNEVPMSLLDLSKPKTIMIYDIGGGTIDVSIHRVHYEPIQELLNIEDLAISRYTNIAGDSFDEAIASDLKNEFYRTLKGKEYTISHLEKATMQKAMQHAENIKLELNERIKHAKRCNEDVSDDIGAEITAANFIGGYPYEDKITKKRFEKLVEPLMGWNLTLADVDRIDELTDEPDIENIVYPVLDTLSKAKEKDPNVLVDAILLNGGMSKLYLIEERIKKLLGEEIIKITDPDLSVARGASICHYYYHKSQQLIANTKNNMVQSTQNNEELEKKQKDKKQKFVDTDGSKTGKVETKVEKKTPVKTGQHLMILNDNINLAVRAGNVYPLIRAGTSLPYESPVFKERFLLSDRTNTIQLPFFMGRGRTTQLPNRRIAWRRAQFNKVYPVGTDISIKISINTERVMKVEAWITKNPSDRVTVKVDTNKENKDKKSSGKKLTLVEPIKLNAKEALNAIEMDCKEIKNKKKAFRKGGVKKLYDRIDLTIDSIRNCLNKEDFGEVINDYLKRISQDSLLRSKLYDIGGYIGHAWKKEDYDVFIDYAIYTISPKSFAYFNNAKTITSSIKALGNLKEQSAIEVLEECIENGKYSNYRDDLRHSLEQIKGAKETVDSCS